MVPITVMAMNDFAYRQFMRFSLPYYLLGCLIYLVVLSGCKAAIHQGALIIRFLVPGLPCLNDITPFDQIQYILSIQALVMSEPEDFDVLSIIAGSDGNVKYWSFDRIYDRTVLSRIGICASGLSQTATSSSFANGCMIFYST